MDKIHNMEIKKPATAKASIITPTENKTILFF
jgi:hypothetical protein